MPSQPQPHSSVATIALRPIDFDVIVLVLIAFALPQVILSPVSAFSRPSMHLPLQQCSCRTVAPVNGRMTILARASERLDGLWPVGQSPMAIAMTFGT